jgi:polysaccharide export outer membrane protein
MLRPQFLAAGRKITLVVVMLSGVVPLFGQFAGPPVTAPVAPQLTGPDPAATPAPGQLEPGIEKSGPIVVFPGDSMEITVVGVPTLAGIHPQVDAEGNISLPYIGLVHVAGLTLPQVQATVAEKYREGQYILNAQINAQVLLAPGQVIAVTGEVKAPQLIPAPTPRRLLEVLAGAGGLTPLASHVITVIRKSTNEGFQIQLDSNPLDSAKVNIPIFAGDTVIVPKAGQVYVIGSVKTPNAIPLVSNSPLTVMQAIALSGGANFEAALSQVRIIRTEGAERKEIALDFKRVLDGKQADPILQADDIIYVPANSFKGALKANGVSILASSIISSAYLLK